LLKPSPAIQHTFPVRWKSWHNAVNQSFFYGVEFWYLPVWPYDNEGKMVNIQEISAQNIRKNRCRCGFTQVQLAILARYKLIVEIMKRLAKVLNY